MDQHHDAVDDLLINFLDVENELDPALLLDRTLAEAVATGAAPQLRDALEAAVRLEDDARIANWFAETGVPDGPSGPLGERARAYLALVAGRLAEIQAGTIDISALGGDSLDGQTWPRAGSFKDQETADAAAAILRSRHAESLEAMRNGELPWSRVHLHGDLAADLGVVGTVDLLKAPQRLGEQPVVLETRTVTHASVIVSRDRPRGLVDLHANPDVALDSDTRKAFPALCHYFGGFFGPGRVRGWNAPYGSSHSANAETKPGGRRAVADELENALTAQSDDELLRTLEACGSYVLPGAVRPWLDRLRWRLDAFDWGESRGRWFS